MTAHMQYDTTANRLTALRIVLVPFVVFFLTKDDRLWGLIAALFFGAAAITDYFDGYYARVDKAVTVLGKLLDPLADKFLVISALVMLMHLGRLHPVIVIVLIIREMAILGLRAIASAEGIVIGASQLAKWKTATQMCAIPMLMLHETYLHVPFQVVGTILIWVSLLISVWSLKDYIVDFFRTLGAKARERREEKKARQIQKRAMRLKKLMERDPNFAATVLEAVAMRDSDPAGKKGLR